MPLGGRLDFLQGDCRAILPTLAAGSVQCCVTSPPYWGLRDYGCDGQLGLESTPEKFVSNMVNVFREVWRVLKDDGTLWLNMGDSYAGSSMSGGGRESSTLVGTHHEDRNGCRFGGVVRDYGTLKSKDLCGIPWRLAFALQADGWYLRSDIIWHKPNPMPESVTDRPTKSHEYIFLLTKSDRYYYDHLSIKEKSSGNSHAQGPNGGPRLMIVNRHKTSTECGDVGQPNHGLDSMRISEDRNKRTVWTVATQPYAEAHFATFPEDLIKPCIMAGSRPGDTVLDPFAGSGTTGKVAIELGRLAILIELSPAYVELARDRTNVTAGFF